ncbi:MAG: hemolysin III family protein [Campylobacterales bacterium]|nr:hemolysin III family protein [Campylobacterales bacterium]
MKTSRCYSLTEEIWHSTIHGVGLLLSVSALSILCVYAGQSGEGAKIASAIVFGLSLMVMYGSSTLYHAIYAPRTKSILQQIDHCAIYILIAGTYTPVSLLGIQGTLGWQLFGIVWGIAALGVTLNLFFPQRFRRPSLILYIIMGWIVVGVFDTLVANLDTLTLALLIAGGVTYTAGVIFYVWRTLNLNHAIWHFFVLGGSSFHFFMVLRLILT